MAHYMEGAAYTVGPTNNISIRNSSMLRNFGGEVLCDATVEQIIIENGRAVGVKVHNTSAGKDSPITEIRAKNIVCATSVFNLHNKLLPQDHPSVKEFNDKSKRSIVESVSTMCIIPLSPVGLSSLKLTLASFISAKEWTCLPFLQNQRRRNGVGAPTPQPLVLQLIRYGRSI